MATEVAARKGFAAEDASADSKSEKAGLPRQPTKNPDGPESKTQMNYRDEIE